MASKFNSDHLKSIDDVVGVFYLTEKETVVLLYLYKKEGTNDKKPGVYIARNVSGEGLAMILHLLCSATKKSFIHSEESSNEYWLYFRREDRARVLKQIELKKIETQLHSLNTDDSTKA